MPIQLKPPVAKENEGTCVWAVKVDGRGNETVIAFLTPSEVRDLKQQLEELTDGS